VAGTFSYAQQAAHYFDRPHETVARRPIGGPAAWRGPALARRDDWRVRLDAAQIEAGTTVRAVELARLASPYAVDNLEGIAATRGARGETLLWLISDDNFNPLQRTLLMMFAVEEEAPPAPDKPNPQ